MNLWTSEDIAKILIQLDERKLPFSAYGLSWQRGELCLLGRGGSAEVYEAQGRASLKRKYAMKVIGFRNQMTDTDFFHKAVQVQKNIGDSLGNVVTVYDYAELWVTLDSKDNVVAVEREKPQTDSRTTIKLQFILMEKVTPVIDRIKAGNISGDEQEILKLAYDIGLALKRAHTENVLHRDVKLENIFYSEKTGQYKLGDFGIAKKTENGFAGTIAFTKGYAAPEVRTSEERYDKTADIYSFGMMLYVLANGLKFPDSNTYNVNLRLQYQPGYRVPPPEHSISQELYQVIAKACAYDPEQRYQSMEEMLLDLEKIMYGESIGYKKEHKNSFLVMGMLMLVAEIVAWKFTMAPEQSMMFSFWEYFFWIGCLGKGILRLYKRDVFSVSAGLGMVGIYLMIQTGFSWGKLLLLLWMVISAGRSAGILSSVMLMANIASLLQQVGELRLEAHTEYTWVPVTLLSIAWILLYQHEVLSAEDRTTVTFVYKKSLFWLLVFLLYGSLILIDFLWNPMLEHWYRSILGNTLMDYFCSFDKTMVGIYGLIFCGIWLVRERCIRFGQRK